VGVGGGVLLLLVVVLKIRSFFFMFCQRILMPLPDKETLKRISLPARIHFTERTGPVPLDPTPSYCNELDLSLGFFLFFPTIKGLKFKI
jgi:hypothetical protein